MPLKQLKFPIAGLHVNLYSSDLQIDPTRPVAVVFLLHGRLSNAKRMHEFVLQIISDYEARTSDAPKDLMVVTFDHRNHGTRLLDKRANQAWDGTGNDHNENHAIDMYTTQTGTARDVSFLIDFLPAYLNPTRNIVEWGVIGISLGGHSVWILLNQEPRITMGIPIIGCPDYVGLMKDRAEGFSIPFAPPYFPDSLRDYVATHDPINSGYTTDSPQTNPFFGKHVLVLSGAEDKLVPWRFSQPFVSRLVVGLGGTKRVVVQEGVGHSNTPEMRAEASDFVCKWLEGALVSGVDAKAAL